MKLPSSGLIPLASVAFAVLALSYIPVGRLLHYASPVLSDDGRLPWLVPLSVAGALAHERVVRGWVFGALRKRLTVGWAALSAAAAGTLVPVAARLLLRPRTDVAPILTWGHAALVAYALSMGLTLLALGAGSTLPGGLALAVVWGAKVAVDVRHVGPTVPLFELAAAVLAAWGVTVVLKGPLAPHRDALLGAA